MYPCHCLIKHDPENEKYGDCLRASIASIFNYEDADEVHHFMFDGDGMESHERLKIWLIENHKVRPCTFHLDGENSLEDVLTWMNTVNPQIYYLLFGATEHNDHVVICRNDKIIHDTAWYSSKICKPSSNGFWGIMIFTHLIKENNE